MAQTFGRSSGDMAADRRFDVAAQLSEDGDHEAAADMLLQALSHVPNWPPLQFRLGETYERSGAADSAAKAYRAYLALDPLDHMGAHLKLTLLGAGDNLPIMPPDYVAGLFDEYAPRFDTSLVDALHYVAPGQIAAALQTIAPSRTYARLLDLGCGTGLATGAVNDICHHKTGIDLSPGMIKQARRKNLYDVLEVASVQDYLTRNSDKKFDLVLCADVFVYIGALDATFTRIAHVMNNNALFAFSVQETNGQDWTLGADHRYAHSSGYIQKLAAQNGLKILHEQQSILRTDGTNNINGLIFICEKLPCPVIARSESDAAIHPTV